MYPLTLTANHSTYSRTGCGISNYYYEAIRATVTESGYYTFISNSSENIYGHIYKDSFSPLTPVTNVISHNGKCCNNYQFNLTDYLHVNTMYILVVTTYHPNITGIFSIDVLGSNNVSLHRIGKYSHTIDENHHRTTHYVDCM